MKKSLGAVIHTFDLEWLRGPASHEDGWIVLDDKQATEYALYVEPQLALDLSYVRTPDDAVSFVQRHGMLWHGPGSEEFREPFSEWDREASRLRGVFSSYAAVQAAMGGDPLALAVIRRLGERRSRIPPSIAPMSDDKVLKRLSTQIATLVTERLAGAQEGLVPLYEDDEVVPGQFAFVMKPRDLLGAVYHQFGQAIVGRIPLAICAGCFRVFEIEDPRQKYCSKSCGSRARYRRWSRKKRRLEGEGTE